MMGGKERQQFAFTKPCWRQLPSGLGIAKALVLSVIYQWRLESFAQRFHIALDGPRSITGADRQVLDGRATARTNLDMELVQASQGTHVHARQVVCWVEVHDRLLNSPE
jgi:hypothetical protein